MDVLWHFIYAYSISSSLLRLFALVHVHTMTITNIAIVRTVKFDVL